MSCYWPRSLFCSLAGLFLILFFQQNGFAAIRDGGIDPANLGKGDWIYSVKDATNQLRGHIRSVTNETSLMQFYKASGVRYIVIKAGTGASLYSGCYADPCQLTANLVSIARANGILIFGYNRSYATNVAGEAAIADYVFQRGADGFVWDAEAEWESNIIGSQGPSLAWQQCSLVRSNWPNKFLAHAPFPIIYFHASFPYKEFGYWCDAVMPQVYHFSSSGIKGSPSAAINWTDVNWRTWQNSLSGSSSVINGQTIYWTNSIKPLALLHDVYGSVAALPAGTTACNGTAPAHPDEDVMEFIDYTAADPNAITVGGYKGVSFWRADLKSSNQWSHVKAGSSGNFADTVNNIVMDDGRAQVIGAWTPVRTFGTTSATSPVFYGDFGGAGSDTNSFGTNYWRKTRGSGAAYLQFNLGISVSGDYDVYEWHVYRTNASASVPFIITHATGSTTVNANQQTNSGNWSLLGRFSFLAGTPANIRVTDAIPETDAVAVVDGLKLVFVPPATLPAAPSALAVIGTTGSRVDLAWRDNATNETGYVIARSTVSGGPYTDLAALSVNVTNYSDATVSAGAAYFYVVRATNYLGASANSAQASAIVPVPPSIAGQPQSQTATEGTAVSFTVQASGSTPLSYQWRFNGTALVGATNSIYTISSVQSSNAGNYSVQVTNSAGSILSSNAILVVNLPPRITVQPQSQTARVGSNVTFAIAATGTQPLAFQWRFNGANISGATASDYTRFAVQTNDAGAYSVVVTNVAGSVVSSNAMLAILLPQPARIESIELLSINRVRLTVVGQSGDRYTMESSESFETWTALQTILNTNGTVQFVDGLSTNDFRRFYRVLSQ
jgi:hypothetical protein